MFGRVGLRKGAGCIVLGLSAWVSRVNAQPSAGFPLDSPAPAPARPSVDPPPASVPPPPEPVLPPPVTAPAPPEVASDYGAPQPLGGEVSPFPSGFPEVLPYRSGMKVPAGYRVESRVSTGLVVTGSVTFALAYFMGLGLALNDDFNNGTGWLAVPLAGPWAAIGAREAKCKIRNDVSTPERLSGAISDARRCFDSASEEATTIGLVAGSGIIQVVGLALLVAGVADQTQELVRKPKRLRVMALPRLNGGLDVGLSVQF